MTTQTETKHSEAMSPGASHATALDWAVFGCLATGVVGLFKALGAESPSGVLLCLLGSVAAFGLVIYLHLRKD